MEVIAKLAGEKLFVRIELCDFYKLITNIYKQ